MNRITGVLYHTLKGTAGWSLCSFSELDVAKIIKVSFSERSFRLFDRDKPFTLYVTYYHPQTTTNIAPVFTNKIGIALYNETVLEQIITKRYATEREVILEIEEIEEKMRRLDRLGEKFLNF